MVTKESDGLHNRSILEAGTSLLAGKAGTILQKRDRILKKDLISNK